jgi:hypothetical protein
MRHAKRKKRIEDLPSIWFLEGRFMLDCGIEQWRRRWDEVYRHEVANWPGPRGTRLDLDSLIIATHPELREDPQGRALFANSFLWELREERRRGMESRRQKRLAQR